MVHQRDSDPSDIIFVGGREYRLTGHALLRIEQREIEIEWIVEVLDNWVARRAMPNHGSINYYGIVPGRSTLFMVAVSDHSPAIPSAMFHSGATARYSRREYDYFDEVRARHEGNSQI